MYAIFAFKRSCLQWFCLARLRHDLAKRGMLLQFAIRAQKKNLASSWAFWTTKGENWDVICNFVACPVPVIGWMRWCQVVTFLGFASRLQDVIVRPLIPKYPCVRILSATVLAMGYRWIGRIGCISAWFIYRIVSYPSYPGGWWIGGGDGDGIGGAVMDRLW
jgi:hypothetical protein